MKKWAIGWRGGHSVFIGWDTNWKFGVDGMTRLFSSREEAENFRMGFCWPPIAVVVEVDFI